MTAVICLNIVFMMMVHADATDKFNTMLSWANVTFTALFVAELVLKWIAIGPITYFRVGGAGGGEGRGRGPCLLDRAHHVLQGGGSGGRGR